MNFSPGKLDYCYMSTLESRVCFWTTLDSRGVLHNNEPGFPGPRGLCTTALDFQGGLSQDTLEIMCDLTPGICLPCPLYRLKMEWPFALTNF